MTDELELLKKDWQKKEVNLPKLSYGDIHRMTWKKSSSIVKWILIISILEFILPQLFYLIPQVREGFSVYEKLGIANYLNGLTIITYAIALYFIVQFYKRFKEISVLEDAKSLMQKIIRTRRTVKYWIIFSLSSAIIMLFMIIIGVILHDNLAHAFPELEESLSQISPEKLKFSLVVSIGGLGFIVILLIGALYFLLYGLLLRKLNKNYRELKQLEF